MKNPETPAGRPESAAAAAPRSEPGIRLNKFLAQNGIASRRKADELIARGAVQVDGAIVTELGTRVEPERQRVEVDGVVLQPGGERRRYYLLNKPRGVVCTNDPREGRTRAVDLITDRKKGRVYTVGRLDEDTEGLVLLTNDGEFANRISHPRYGVLKTYWVDVRGRVGEEALAEMRAGVRLAEGRSHFERVGVKKRSEERTILLVTIGEGKNREVRRVLASLGFAVRKLRRVAIGLLRDRKLKVGEWRPLTKSEVGLLLAASEPGGATGERELRPWPRRRSLHPGRAPRRPWSSNPPRRGQAKPQGRRRRSRAAHP